MPKSVHFKTIVISDVHLGTKNSRARELVWFLKKFSCDKLILNGDIIDGWRLRKSGKWKKIHTRFFKVILKMIQNFNTQVVYIRGNHDDILDRIIPVHFGNISISRDYIHVSNGKKFYVIHGDVFDAITSNLKWLAKLGDVGYTFLLWVNKVYNHIRVKRGLPYYSLSKVVKNKVKTAVAYVSNYESELVKLARQKKCHGIICGHIHHPAITQYEDILYLNSGDWVESLTALTEDYSGNWQILHYTDLIAAEDTSENQLSSQPQNGHLNTEESVEELEAILT
jgi:UDP-2,3-diacylglucosamine pyrophosphatase LpxH